MKIVVDLDGVIIGFPSSKKDKEVRVNEEMVKWLRKRKSYGDYIVIHTARGMRSNNNDLGKVYTKHYVEIYEMLKSKNIPFDELILGKPNADIYIDDKAVRFDYSIYKEKFLPNFIITAAGEGKRLSHIGKKPLINLKGKTIMEWAISSLPLDISNKIYFLYKDDEIEKKFVEILKKYYNDEFINDKLISIKLEQKTSGQAETAYAVKSEIDKDIPIVIYNIDTYFESYYIKSRLLTFFNEYDGFLGGFVSNNANMSYFKVNGDLVVEIEEKKVISDIASTGLYGFRSFQLYEKYYLKYASEAKGELYIAPIYRYMIMDGLKITYDIAELCYPLGTEEEIRIFNEI
jgi:capsule biosynthesis phosphatase